MPPVIVEVSDDESCPQLYSDDDTMSDDDADDEEDVPREKLPKSVRSRPSDRAVSARGLSGKNYRKMVRLGCPVFLMNILFFLFHSPTTSNVRDLQCIEHFAGVSAVYRGAIGRGFAAARCDIIFDSVLHDISSINGFVYAV